MMKFATIMKFLKVVVANRQSIARHRHTAEPPVPKLQPIGFDDFLSLDVPPREVLLDPILPERSLAMLYAPRGVGKTLLATSRRKIEISGIVIDGRAERKARRGDRRACLNSDCGCGG